MPLRREPPLPPDAIGEPSGEPSGGGGSCGCRRQRWMLGPAVAAQRLLRLSSTANFATPAPSQASSSLTRVDSCVLHARQGYYSHNILERPTLS